MFEKETPIEQLLNTFKTKHPTIEYVSVGFDGGGDSFNQFWDVNCTPETEVKEEDVSDILWWAIRTQGEADFNNEGAEGMINIDLKEDTVTIETKSFYNDTQQNINIEFKL